MSTDKKKTLLFTRETATGATIGGGLCIDYQHAWQNHLEGAIKDLEKKPNFIIIDEGHEDAEAFTTKAQETCSSARIIRIPAGTNIDDDFLTELKGQLT